MKLDSSRPVKSSNLGRVSVIIILICCVFGFTHFLLPAPQNKPILQPYSNSHLKPINYLNSSEPQPNPFPFCPLYGPGDHIGAKYGAFPLSQSRLHLGSGHRIHKVLSRAISGQPVTISIIGGSVSACHGAGDDPISPICYPSRFFTWWNQVFPHPATELTNGAMRRSQSSYFGFCSKHHLPDVTDLVIIELDSDDSPNNDMMENFELLIRSLLLRPDQPAVLLLGHFSPQVHQSHGFAGPDHVHDIVAQFYDVPHISTKPVLFTEYMRDPTAVTKKYYVDPVLASPAGHQVLSDVLISYFQSQICSSWDIVTGTSQGAAPSLEPLGDSRGLFGGVGARKGVPEPGEESDAEADVNHLKHELPLLSTVHVTDVPSARINTRPNAARPFEEIAPYCVSANDLINPLPPSLFFGSGWYSHSAGNNALQVRAHYWHSTLPTSKLRIPLQVGAGDIGVYYLQEPISEIGQGSSVECWVDDNYGGSRVIENAANVGEPTARLMMIDHYVSRGSHYVECQLLGEEGMAVPSFKIIGIFSS